MLGLGLRRIEKGIRFEVVCVCGFIGLYIGRGAKEFSEFVVIAA